LRVLRLYREFDPADKTERKYRLANLRDELRLTRKELAELEKYAHRIETLQRHQRRILRLISDMENWNE